VPASVQVLQRGLPRPSAPELVAPSQPEADASTLAYGEAAEALLRHELAAMVKFDNAAYPIKVGAQSRTDWSAPVWPSPLCMDVCISHWCDCVGRMLAEWSSGPCKLTPREARSGCHSTHIARKLPLHS